MEKITVREVRKMCIRDREYIYQLKKADKENRDFLSGLIGGMKFEQ